MKKSERERPSWDEWFMFSALWAATRSSCKYLQTGVVIVKENRIIASGYNGAPPGIRNCLEIGCRKETEGVDFNVKGRAICRGNHAEINAMNQISRWDLKGTTLYTFCFPCSVCAKAIVSSGIQKVIYSRIYEESESLTSELFSEAGVKLRQLEIDIEKYFGMIKRIFKKEK